MEGFYGGQNGMLRSERAKSHCTEHIFRHLVVPVMWFIFMFAVDLAQVTRVSKMAIFQVTPVIIALTIKTVRNKSNTEHSISLASAKKISTRQEQSLSFLNSSMI